MALNDIKSEINFINEMVRQASYFGGDAGGAYNNAGDGVNLINILMDYISWKKIDDKYCVAYSDDYVIDDGYKPIYKIATVDNVKSIDVSGTLNECPQIILISEMEKESKSIKAKHQEYVKIMCKDCKHYSPFGECVGQCLLSHDYPVEDWSCHRAEAKD